MLKFYIINCSSCVNDLHMALVTPKRLLSSVTVKKLYFRY